MSFGKKREKTEDHDPNLHNDACHQGTPLQKRHVSATTAADAAAIVEAVWKLPHHGSAECILEYSEIRRGCCRNHVFDVMNAGGCAAGP